LRRSFFFFFFFFFFSFYAPPSRRVNKRVALTSITVNPAHSLQQLNQSRALRLPRRRIVPPPPFGLFFSRVPPPLSPFRTNVRVKIPLIVRRPSSWTESVSCSSTRCTIRFSSSGPKVVCLFPFSLSPQSTSSLFFFLEAWSPFQHVMAFFSLGTAVGHEIAPLGTYSPPLPLKIRGSPNGNCFACASAIFSFVQKFLVVFFGLFPAVNWCA